MSKSTDKWLIKCMVMSFLIGLASFGIFMIRDKGAFILMHDFSRQQIPFCTGINSFVKNDFGEWTWNVGLGTQFIGAYSFYELGSPFFWISVLGKPEWFPYMVGWIYILKYSVASITSCFYLREFLTDKRYAAAGALLYAFSGFQCTNLEFYHFHDVVALFPLLLFGLEHCMKTGKKGWFVFSIFLNCLVNYFFFVGEVVFLVFYFLLRFWDKPVNLLRKMGSSLFCGIVGIGMAGILFLPSIIHIMGNDRAGIAVDSLFYDRDNLLFVIKGLLVPDTVMGDHSMVLHEQWGSVEAYLPVLGISLVICYIRKQRDWLSRLLIVLTVMSFSPVLTSLFTLFTAVYYRWWYMYILMLVLASCKVLECRERYPYRKGILCNAVLAAVFYAVLFILQKITPGKELILRPKLSLFYVIFTLMGLFLLYMVMRSKKHYERNLLCLIAVGCFMVTWSSVYLYREEGGDISEFFVQYELSTKLKTIDDQYRYGISNNILTSMEGAGTSTFISTASNSRYRFEELFDYQSDNLTIEVENIPGLTELVGGKYTINTTGEGKIADTIEIQEETFYVEEKDACPIGFEYDSYLFRDELKELPLSERGIAMLDNLIIDAEQESVFQKYLTHASVYQENDSQLLKISDYVSEHEQSKVENFRRSSSGIYCTSDAGKDRVIFFSIPYDKGWTAFIDGSKTDIFETAGMMSLIVPSGQHEIEFVYKTPYLRTGILCSILSFIAWIIIVFLECKRTTAKKQSGTLP